MPVLNAEQIIGAEDLKRELVAVPEWGEGAEVIVSEMTGEARDEWGTAAYRIDGDKVELVKKNFRATLLAFCLVGEDGERLFGPADVAKLGRKSGKVLDRLFAVADRLNGITGKAVADIEKN